MPIALTCVLCGSPRLEELSFSSKFHRCGDCRLVFRDPAERLGAETLRGRYLLHENGPEQEGYRRFLAQAVEAARPFLRRGMRGLDYGCGPGPALAVLAAQEGVEVQNYDPLFYPEEPKGFYDAVFSTECFEHFEEAGAEIARVAALVAPGGLLVVMTSLWDDATDFSRWHYARDESHVSFYHDATFDWFAARFGFERLAGDGRRTFVFRKCAR